MAKETLKITTEITLTQVMPIDELDDYDMSDKRTDEYIAEVKEFINQAVDSENTTVDVVVHKEEI